MPFHKDRSSESAHDRSPNNAFAALTAFEIGRNHEITNEAMHSYDSKGSAPTSEPTKQPVEPTKQVVEPTLEPIEPTAMYPNESLLCESN